MPIQTVSTSATARICRGRNMIKMGQAVPVKQKGMMVFVAVIPLSVIAIVSDANYLHQPSMRFLAKK